MGLLPHQFGSNTYQTTLKGMVIFELKSWLGRTFVKPRAPTKAYLHVGSGTNILGNFENLDFYSFRTNKVARSIIGHDLRYVLPYTDATFQGAYSEHTLEHLYPNHALQLLREMYRVLKPGAIFRCAVPDLQKYVDYYLGKPVDPTFKQFESGCEAIWSLTQNWGHISVWDSSMLIRKLKEAGFRDAVSKNFREGANPDLLVDMEGRRWETLYVEAVR